MLKSSIIFGLDILGRSKSGEKSFTFFSLIVLGYNHLDKYPRMTRRTLFAKIFDLKPDFIAMDNIFELTPNANGIVRFLQKIPTTTSLVQVTGNPRTGMEKITNLVQKYGLKKNLSFSYDSQKLNSIETAEICAYLCQKRIGHEVIAFEDEVRITISMKKSHRKGGWSAPRYDRIGKNAVHETADEIEQILRKKNIIWEFFEYPRRRVYIAQLEKVLMFEINDLLKPLSTDLVRVTVERITKSNLDFRPLDIRVAPTTRSLKNIIIGIDPGTTTGIAVIDLIKGHVLYLGSKRECGISEIIRIVSDYGKITCVAADVTPVPAMVEKIAKITGAKIIFPSNLSSAAQKREYLHDYEDLTVNYGHLNSHERDALFAAIKAYNSLKDQLLKIQKIIFESYPHLESKLSEIQRVVLAGNNISTAIKLVCEREKLYENSLGESEKHDLDISLKRENEQLLTKIETIYEELNKLENEITFWRKQASNKSAEVKKWKDFYERERLKRSLQEQKKISEAIHREVGRIRDENQQLRHTIREQQIEMEKIKQIKNFWVQGSEIPLKVIDTFSESSIRNTEKRYRLNEGDIVLVLNPSGGGAQTAQKLIDTGVRGIVIPENSAKFSDQALRKFDDNCVPFIELPMKEFSQRSKDLKNPNLEIWVYEGLFLTDISIKDEIRRRELKLQEKLRQKRMLLIPKTKLMTNPIISNELDIERILNDFKEDYISQYRNEYDSDDDFSEEE